MAQDALVVHPRWQAWVAENLALGATPDELAAALEAEGLEAARARELVEDVSRSPAMAAMRALGHRVDALERMLRLRREHRGVLDAIRRGPLPSPERFLAEHWLPGVPLVVTDLVPRWPAARRWSHADFAARLGDVVLEACVGRSAHPDPDPEWADLVAELTMAELVERIEAPGAGNDVYVIAKNAALRRPALAPLLDDIALPPAFFGPKLEPTRMGLWIGPAGTHTPLHHDFDNAMFCQVVGRKRFRLAPPESLALLECSRGVYSTWDPRDASELEAGPERLLELVLAPGEALFIPAGWWHQVDALDPSISVSVLEFAWANDYSWYRPGTALRGRGPI